MTLQFSVDVRNARLDALEDEIGASPILRIRTGAVPANCAAADTGDVLATIALPADWLAAAVAGAKDKSGTWQDAAADDDGIAAHFRIYDNGDTACEIQGTVTAIGGSGDMEVDNTNFAAGQTFTITSFTITDGNA